MANGRVIACIFASLWLLSPSPPASGWSSPATAVPIAVGETTPKAVVNNLEEKQYRRFNLISPGYVLVNFTHLLPGDPSAIPGWKISLLKLVGAMEQNSFSTTSYLMDRGVTCSTYLDAGTHYLLVQGAVKAADQAAPLNLPYQLALSTQYQDLTLVRLEQELEEKATHHQTVMGAYGAVPSQSRSWIKCRHRTYRENLLFDKPDATLLIDGGKDSCFDQTTGFTTIQGELLVRRGTLYVKGLTVQGP